MRGKGTAGRVTAEFFFGLFFLCCCPDSDIFIWSCPIAYLFLLDVFTSSLPSPLWKPSENFQVSQSLRMCVCEARVFWKACPDGKFSKWTRGKWRKENASHVAMNSRTDVWYWLTKSNILIHFPPTFPPHPNPVQNFPSRKKDVVQDEDDVDVCQFSSRSNLLFRKASHYIAPFGLASVCVHLWVYVWCTQIHTKLPPSHLPAALRNCSFRCLLSLRKRMSIFCRRSFFSNREYGEEG